MGRCPPCHFLNHVERLLVAAIGVHVEKAGHDLVNCVEGSPHPLTLAQAVEELNWEGAQVATLQRVLALAQFTYDGIGVVLQVFISYAGIHQGASRKVVAAGVVTAKLAVWLFPSPERLRGRGNGSIDSKRVQEPVGWQRTQILTVGLHCDFARPVSQSHLLQREGTYFQGDFLMADGLARLLSCVHHGILRGSCHQRSGYQSGTGSGRNRCHEMPAREFPKSRH